MSNPGVLWYVEFLCILLKNSAPYLPGPRTKIHEKTTLVLYKRHWEMKSAMELNYFIDGGLGI